MDVEVAAPSEAPAVEAPVETSLADHEAQFGPGAQRDPQSPPPNGAAAAAATDDDADRDPGGRFRKRAQSQQATAKDVDQISELTRRWRQAEADAGIKIEKQLGESDRAFGLRRQVEMAEALRDARKASSAPPAAPQQQLQPYQQVAPAGTQPTNQPAPFAEPVPKPEDFATAEDPATEYYRAVAGHEFRRQIHDAQQMILAQRAQQSQHEAIAKSHEVKAALDAKIAEFEKTEPDFQAALDRVNVPELALPNVMIQAIASDVDTAPKLMYYLATHPEHLEDAIAFAIPFGDDLSAPSVALMRRRLNRYVRDIDVQKGASPPAQQPILVAPRPPTPLGTGPLKTGDEPPSDDDSSILNHEKYFGRKRR